MAEKQISKPVQTEQLAGGGTVTGTGFIKNEGFFTEAKKKTKEPEVPKA